MNEDYITCPHCGERVLKDDAWLVGSGEYVCGNCFDTLYVKCDGCGKDVLSGNTKIVGDKILCEDCVNDWGVCSDCGDAHRINELLTTHDGNIICYRCYDRDYFRCSSCDEVFHLSDRFCIDGDDYCECCYNRHIEDHNAIMEYHSFESRRYIPRMIPNENTKLFFGVELECDDGAFGKDDFAYWTEDTGLIHFESDGSLSCYGVECITMPCSLKFHQEKMRWHDLCSVLESQGFRSHNTDCCGLHVHISRAALSPIQIIKMDTFINRAGDFFSQIARRSDFYNSSYNKYKKADIGKGGVEHRHRLRYTAVNTTNKNTVEIRIFRGTLKSETILGTIEMCHALVGFLDTVSIAKIYETEKNIADFVKYMAEHHKEYPNLFPMMRRLVKHGWDKMVGRYYGELYPSSTNNCGEQ